VKSIDIYRAFGNIDDALLEMSEELGEASFTEIRTEPARVSGGREAVKPSLRNAGKWLRRHSGLIAAFAVCIAVGAFAVFGGGMHRAGSSSSQNAAPAAAESAPAIAAAPAEAPMEASNSMVAPSSAGAEESLPESADAYSYNTTTQDNKAAGSDSKAADRDGAEAFYGALEEIDEINLNGVVYKAVFDDVYRLGEALGDEYQGYQLYAVDGYEESEMLALYDPETDLAQFFLAE